MIYLDNAATTMRKPPEVVRAVTGALQSFGGAGRGAHGAALAAFESVGADIYRTDTDGTIVCYADEAGKLQVACGGKNTAQAA